MNQLCKVCSEPAAGYHFGAFTCEGCKSFFGRTYNNLGALGECKNNGQCVINKKNRTSCKSCRLKKCLVVGMSKSGSRYGRRSNWFKIHCLIQDQAEMKNRIKEDGMTEETTTDEGEGMTEDLMSTSSRSNMTRDGMYQSDLIASHAHLLQQQKHYRNSTRDKHTESNNNNNHNHGSSSVQRSVNNHHHHHNNHSSSSGNNNNHTSSKSHHHQRKSSGSPSSSSTISSNSPPSSSSSKELMAAAAAAAVASANVKGSINPFSHLMGLHHHVSSLHPQHQAHLMSLAAAACSAGNSKLSSGSPALSSSSTTSSNSPPSSSSASKEQLLAAAAAAAAFNPFSHLMMHPSQHHVSSSLQPHPADFMSMAAAAAALAGGKVTANGSSPSSPTFSNFSPQSSSSSKEFFAAAAAAALKPFSHLFLHPSHHVSAQLHQHQADLMSAAVTGKVTPVSTKLSSSSASGKLTPGSLSDMPEQEKPIDLSIKTEDEEETRTRSCSPADSFDSDIEVSAY